ncbi:MAG TPA: DUF1145 domain-containing protein [Halieaceae bacterium]|nr:DUF1145 domain-containing protein [Halieaceae bacterium]
MNKLLTIGKMSTIGLWVLPVLALIGIFSAEWNHNILWITVLIFFAHLGELLAVKGKLKMHGRDTIHDGLMVILAGFFHWLPITKDTN